MIILNYLKKEINTYGRTYRKINVFFCFRKGFEIETVVDDVEWILDQYQKVICECTNGLLSKLNYDADVVISHICDENKDMQLAVVEMLCNMEEEANNLEESNTKQIRLSVIKEIMDKVENLK